MVAAAEEVFDVPKKRWKYCFILQTLISAFIWFLLASSISSFFIWSKHSRYHLSYFQKLLRFSTFLASQVVFLLGEALVIHPEDKNAATATDIIFGILKLVWGAIIGGSSDKDSALVDGAIFVRKLQISRDRALFAFLCAISGSLAIISLTWNSSSRLTVKEDASRGAALGLLYGLWHLYTKKIVLRFPIIQRSLFFTLKLGFKEMIRRSSRLAVLSLPFAEASILILNASSFAVVSKDKSETSFVVRELDFLVLATVAALLWEISHHVLEALHTRRFRFAPPFGTSAAETNPSDMLLVALEQTERSSVIHYLAFLDLCMVSEHNSDAWRLHAVFEETGETYSRLVSACLKPLNTLIMKLSKGLDGYAETHERDSLKQQMQTPGLDMISPAYQILHDYQLCSWSARILSSLTASSKCNDRYGVAQLRGCNSAVVSSLISCFLIIEVYLGRRSSTHPGQMIGVQSIKWTIPSRGLVDPGNKQSFPFPKKAESYKKAHVMADVLRTSLYQIVTTFRKEMDLRGPGGILITERDWLDKGQPLYGTRELHMRILRSLLDFRM